MQTTTMNADSRGRVALVPGWALGVLGFWGGGVLALNATGLFVDRPGAPPLALLLAVVVPPAACLVALRVSGAARGAMMALDLRLLTVLQAWRVIGVVFLVLMGRGLLPGSFAWPAGLGDVLVGVYAPFVVLLMVRGAAGWRRHAIALNVLGLVDFVGAVGMGVLSGQSRIGVLSGELTTRIMTELPLSMIPTFGVPFWIVVHIIALAQLRDAARREPGRPRM